MRSSEKIDTKSITMKFSLYSNLSI